MQEKFHVVVSDEDWVREMEIPVARYLELMDVQIIDEYVNSQLDHWFSHDEVGEDELNLAKFWYMMGCREMLVLLGLRILDNEKFLKELRKEIDHD